MITSKSIYQITTICLTTFWLLGLVTAAAAQSQEEETTRRLWDTAFINSGNRRTANKKPTARRSYRIAIPSIPTINVAGDTVIGVTVWRLRPPEPSDRGERILVQEGAASIDWTPERVEADTKLTPGTRVRLSVEAARTGYLYVIDREQYADGALGEPLLIFPTTRTNGGNNQVKPGRLIEIPTQDDEPPFFALKPSRSDQVSEVISVLVSPTPLEGLKIGANAQRLSVEQVAAWEKSWGGTLGRLELENGAGRTCTKEEKQAGADTTRSLNQDEPAPQTLYYKPDAKSGQPMMANVALQYGWRRPAVRSRRR